MHDKLSTSDSASGSGAALGYALALCATVLWSTVFLLARVLAGEVSPVELSFWRWFVAFLAILPFTAVSVWRHRALIREHLLLVWAAGVLGFTLFSVLVFKAGHTTQATNLSLIAASSPIFMALLSRFFLGERLSSRQKTGLLIAAGGVLVLVLRGDFSRLAKLAFAEGDLWMLGAAFLFALYSVLIKRRPAGLPQTDFLCVMLGMGSLSLFPFLFREMTLPSYHIPSMPHILALLFMGIGPSLLGYYCWNLAVAKVGAARAGVIYYSVPLFSSIEATFILHEYVTLAQIAGGALIIGGIFFSSMDALHLHKAH